MKGGRLVEHGTHGDSMTREGEYFMLYNAPASTLVDNKASEHEEAKMDNAQADEPREDHTTQDFKKQGPAKPEDSATEDDDMNTLDDPLPDSGPALRHRLPQRPSTL